MDNTTTSGPVLIPAWSTPRTFAEWIRLPSDERRRTVHIAMKFPYKDSPRAWEHKKVLHG